MGILSTYPDPGITMTVSAYSSIPNVAVSNLCTRRTMKERPADPMPRASSPRPKHAQRRESIEAKIHANPDRDVQSPNYTHMMMYDH